MAKPANDEENDSTAPAAEQRILTSRTGFIGAVKAAARLGVAQLEFERMARDGELTKYRSKDGATRYDPAELEELAADLEKIPKPAPVMPMAEGFHAGTSLVRQAQSNVEALMKLIVDPMKLALASLKDTNEALLEENKELREGREATVAAREALLNQQLERDLLRNMAQKREQWRDDVWKETKPQIGRIVDAVSSKWLKADPDQLKKMEAAQKLIQGLDIGKLAALMEMDFLSDAEKDHLRVILGKSPTAATPPKTDGAPATEPPKTESPKDSPDEKKESTP